MFGIITTLLTLQGIGLGTYAAGAGVRSWFRKIDEQSRRKNIKVKKLRHGWSILVEEAYYDTVLGRYFGKVRCETTNRSVIVSGKTEEELRASIDKAVEQLGTEYDRWKKVHIPWL